MKYCTPLFERLKPEKQERILTTAVSEFSKLGYRTANINVIAEKSGISVGSLYKYFETKENLFLCVCSLSADDLKSVFKFVDSLEGDFFSKIEKLLRLILDYSRKNPDTIHLYQEVTTQGNRDLAGKLSYEVESISAEYYAKLLTAAKENGEIDPDIDERMAAFCLDNIFMSLQFSYAAEFYQERMKIYVADNIFENDERVISESIKFLKKALI
ncbi:MAG: TetR/AcrR family transcriptional regulator [Spirochaetales bacterium]|nr:TetR/AcrR family transcriptional regulator [Spirochaetales bacterium]